MTLPPCDRRGLEAHAGFFECSSNRLIHPEHGIASAYTCSICPYRNKPDRDGTPAVDTYALRRARGLGDVVASVLSWMGIEKTPGCGCTQRQELLNQLVPFGK